MSYPFRRDEMFPCKNDEKNCVDVFSGSMLDHILSEAER